YFGSSTCPAHQIVQGQWISDRRNLRAFATEQPPYSLLVRKAEAGLLPICRAHELGAMCWSPLAGGWLSGAFHTGGGLQDNKTRTNRAQRMPQRFDLTLPGNVAKLEAVRT